MENMKMSKPVIKGIDNNDAGFKVSFKNGFNGDLDIELVGLHIDADGGSILYASLEACANYILDSVEEMKRKPQVEFNLDHLKDKDGVLNCSVVDGNLVTKK